MSSRASSEHTIFAEIDGLGPAFSHFAFSNTGALVEGGCAVEPLLPHALSASTATSPHPAIDRLRTTERY